MRALMVGVGIALGAGLLVQTIRHAALARKNHELEREIAELRTPVMPPRQSPAPPGATEMTAQERTELLRLRNQAAQLRVATNEVQQLRAQVGQLGTSLQRTTLGGPSADGASGEIVSKEAWRSAGYATPEAALQSVLFAMTQGDRESFMVSLSPEEAQRASQQFEGKTPEQIAERWRRDTEKITSYRILERDEVSPEEVVLVIYAAGERKVLPLQMRRVGEEWKFAGVATDRR